MLLMETTTLVYKYKNQWTHHIYIDKQTRYLPRNNGENGPGTRVREVFMDKMNYWSTLKEGYNIT